MSPRTLGEHGLGAAHERSGAGCGGRAAISPHALSSIADGKPINATENRTFVRSFLSQLSPAERAALLDAGGNLSQAGVRRMEAAMASRAYGDGEFVAGPSMRPTRIFAVWPAE